MLEKCHTVCKIWKDRSLAPKISHAFTEPKEKKNRHGWILDECLSLVSLLLPTQTIVLSSSKAHITRAHIENTKDGLHPRITQNPKAAVVSLHNAGTLCFRVLELHVIGIGVEHFTPNADSEDRRSRVAGHLVQLSLLVEESGRIDSLCHHESNRIVQVDQSRARVDDSNDAGVVGVSGGFFWVRGRSSQSGLSWILPGLGEGANMAD
jgi:hypothetical protein